MVFLLGTAFGLVSNAVRALGASSSNESTDVKYLSNPTGIASSDRKALDKALNELRQAGGGVLQIGKGKWNVGDRPIIIEDDDFVIRGEGSGLTTVLSSCIQEDLIAVKRNQSSPHRVVLRDFSLEYAGDKKTTGAGIHLHNCYDCLISGIYALGSLNVCLQITAENGALNNCYGNRVVDFKTFGGMVGLQIADYGGVVQNLTVERFEFSRHSEVGIRIIHASGLRFVSGEVLACNQGVQVCPSIDQAVDEVLWIGNYIDSCTTSGLLLSDGGGEIARWQIIGGSTLSSNGSDKGKGANVIIKASQTGNIRDISFSDHSMGNAAGDGVYIESGKSIRFTNCSNNGNNTHRRDGVGFRFVGTNADVVVSGGSSRGSFGVKQLNNRSGWPDTQSYGVFLDGESIFCGVMNGVDLSQNTIAPMYVGHNTNHGRTSDFISSY